MIEYYNRRRIIQTPTPPLPTSLIHHFPLDSVSGLNDIKGSGILSPYQNRIAWNNTDNHYLFTFLGGNASYTGRAADLSNLILGQINGQPLDNLSICLTLIVKSYTSNWGLEPFRFANQQMLMGMGTAMAPWYFPVNTQLKYVLVFDKGQRYDYFNGVLINSTSGNNSPSNNITTAIFGGASSGSAGTAYLWNLQIHNKSLTQQEVQLY